MKPVIKKPNRVVLIVLDSVGIGELPDAHLFGDQGSNTVGNIARQIPTMRLPNLLKMGLGNIEADLSLGKVEQPTGAYGKAIEISQGKDTTTGHWEISGLVLEQAFPTFPDGFPPDIIEAFEAKIGTKTIGNKAASGTVIIEELGAEHERTGYPIVYTSADSVFQLAAHEDLYPIEKQYEMCSIAREMLVGEQAVGRVIARPFVGKSGSYQRTARRKDFSLLPPDKTILNLIAEAGLDVQAVGKIKDIFAASGITQSVKTADNQEGIDRTIEYLKMDSKGLIFTNLVDFDMHYGHRNNVSGYANCLMEFDQRLPEILAALKDTDLLLITADHGNDPTTPGTDHSREYIPILVYGKAVKAGVNIGTRATFADIGATIADVLGVSATRDGESFWEIMQVDSRF